MRYVGIDVHRDFCEIAVHEAGRTVRWVATSHDQLQALAESLSAEDRVAIETTGNARRIAEILGVHAGVLAVHTSQPAPSATPSSGSNPDGRPPPSRAARRGHVARRAAL